MMINHALMKQHKRNVKIPFRHLSQMLHHMQQPFDVLDPP
jgi:hypothetical protein